MNEEKYAGDLTLVEMGEQGAKVYSAALSAIKWDYSDNLHLATIASAIVARSPEEAEEIGLRVCHKLFPAAEAFGQHNCVVVELHSQIVLYCKAYL